MKTKNKTILIIIIIITSFSLTLFIDRGILSALLEKIIFNAISVLVGLSIAIIGIFLSSINTLYLSLYKIVKTKNQEVFNKDEIATIKNGLNNIVKELKDNTMHILSVFVIILVLFLLKEVDIPKISWFIDSNVITKEFIINCFILIGNFLIFWAIIDSIQVIFKITKAFELMEDE